MSEFKMIKTQETGCVALVATSHDSQGTVTWTDNFGQKYVSTNSKLNTSLLLLPSYENVGTLLHKTGSYYLQRTTCRERGYCTESCRCTDCPERVATGEDIDTESALGDLAKKASSIAKGAWHGAKAGYTATQKAHDHVKSAKSHLLKAIEDLNKITEDKVATDDHKEKVADAKEALKNASEKLNALETSLL